MPVEGQILGGKYRLERLVGSGGFASVWAARNVMLDRVVALKILSENYARMPGFLPRFLREAKLASRSIHKTIVGVEDIDQTPDGIVYLVMELLEGHTLADELKGGKSLTLERTLEVITPTLEGLSAAHKRNIIHRDIKPANIFLTQAGSPGPHVRILDLGLAKDLLHDDELTSTDQMVGTPSYLAPEMFLGPQTRKWAPSADVFACGMLMFRMLAGGLPFDRSVAKLSPIEQFLARAEFYQNIGQMPGPKQYVDSIPEAIDIVVRQAINLSVRERYDNAGGMLIGLKTADITGVLVALSSEDDLTVNDLDDTKETNIEPDTGDYSNEFDDEVETKVDAAPFRFEDVQDSSIEESVATNPASALPNHLQPVAGRTIPPFDDGGSSDQQIPVPSRVSPAIERRADYPSTSPAAAPSTGDVSSRQSPLPSQSYPPKSPFDRSSSSPPKGLETPPTKAVEPFGLSSVADQGQPNRGSGYIDPSPSSPSGGIAIPVTPDHRGYESSGSVASSRSAPPPRRRSRKVAVSVAIGILLVLVGLVTAGLYLTWSVGCWGRHATSSASLGECFSRLSNFGERETPSPPPNTTQQSNGVETPSPQEAVEVVSLEISSVPTGATVILDGQQVGTTPYQTSLQRSDDARQLTVRAEGYIPVEQIIRANEPRRLEFELQPAHQ